MKGRKKVVLYLLLSRVQTVSWNQKQKWNGTTCNKGHDQDLNARLLGAGYAC